jgi:Domain of unknown function (DUF4178)
MGEPAHMTQPTANCPNCGAKIVFRWSSSVQTVCEYCKSILVRTDIDLKKVGQVADLPPNSSPIQLGTEGVYRHQAFVAVGRIIYEYAQGTWNEWHLVMNNSSAWLSDAQDEYVVTFPAPGRKLPTTGQAQVGRGFVWDAETYIVTTITQAHYRGVEGELPFQYWDKDVVTFVDLMTTNGKFATLDYSDEAPVLYLGESVEFESLSLKNLRSFEGW